MRTGFLGSLSAMLVLSGTAWGQGMPAPAAIGPSRLSSDVRPVEGWTAPPPVVLPGLPGVPPGGPPIDAPLANGAAPQPPVPIYPPPGPYGAPLFETVPGPSTGGGNASGTAPHYWSSFEYLLWFPQSQRVPFTLLTSSAPNDAGRIGRASTVNLVPEGDYSYGVASGFRITLGAFGDEDRRFGAEAVGFSTEQKSNILTFYTQAGGIPALARPFVDSTTFANDSAVVGNLFFGSGSAVFDTSTQTWGMEGNGVINVYRSSPENTFQFTIDAIAGYRFLQLTEDLVITSLTDVTRPPSTVSVFGTLPNGDFLPLRSFVVSPVIPVGGTTVAIPGSIVIQDSFSVQNRFNGGQVGGRMFSRYGMFSLLLSGKVAFGAMKQTVDISGATGIFDGHRGFTGGSYGGVLANASNIGRFTNTQYAVIPEFNAALGVNLTRYCIASIGYNLLYIDNVIRPGSLINPVVNVAQLPLSNQYGATGTLPTVAQALRPQEFFLHGVNFGLSFRY